MTDGIEIHVPAYARRASAVESIRRVPAPRRTAGDPLRISFVDNEKPNTTRLLELVSERLGARYAVETSRFTKGGAGLPAPHDVIEAAARDADLVVLATCD
jgi:hypothetical protein